MYLKCIFTPTSNHIQKSILDAYLNVKYKKKTHNKAFEKNKRISPWPWSRKRLHKQDTKITSYKTKNQTIIKLINSDHQKNEEIEKTAAV